MIREMERETGKSINLVIEGADTAIDKIVADRLYDPLCTFCETRQITVETTEERLAKGKDKNGVITLSAAQVGGEVCIVVADDGRGLNREKICQRRAKRIFGADEEPEGSVLWKVIFEPGFSTAENVTNLSGRGVGMDVLNSTMKDLRGRITVDSEQDQGSRVALHIPVSLAFLDCVILRLGPCLFAVPVDDISEIVKPQDVDLVDISADEGSEMMRLRGQYISIRRLDNFTVSPKQSENHCRKWPVSCSKRHLHISRCPWTKWLIDNKSF